MFRRRKIIYFDALSWSARGAIGWRSKLWLFVYVTKSSFNHRSLAFSYLFGILWVLLYCTEPSVKKVEVVDCDFIAVPLILAVTANRIFYTVTDLERPVINPQSASSSVIWKTMIFENQIPHVKLMSTYITWKPVRQPFTNIHYPLSHARFPSHHLNTSLF